MGKENIQPVESTIQSEVEKVQKAWGDGIVAIGKISKENGNVQDAAAQHVDEFYGYDLGQVCFKPTKASEKQWRPTREEAISYFVGGVCEEDHGFALQPWVAVRFEGEGMMQSGEMTMSWGNYYFTDEQGAETKVEYHFAYVRDGEGKLKIVQHISTLPYSPAH